MLQPTAFGLRKFQIAVVLNLPIVRRSASTGATNDVAMNPAWVIKLMSGKVRFLAVSAIARIRLIWQNWRQISQCRI